MYNSERLIFAFSALSDDKLERVAIALGYARQRRRRTLRVSRALAVAAVIAAFLALGAVAYAADLLGLRTLFANPNRGEMPEEAADLILSQSEMTEGSGWSAQVSESYCDAGTVLVSLHVHAEAGYVLAPTDADLESPLSVIGRPGEGTLGDYAQREGKTLLFVGASLDREALGLTSLGERFENVSAQEMTIYVEGARSGGPAVPADTVCTVTAAAWRPEAPEAEAPAVERRTLAVTFADAGGEDTGTYLPTDPAAVPGMLLGELRLTRTPLGLSLRLPITPTEPDAFERLLTIRLREIEFHGAGEIRQEEDGSVLVLFRQGQGEAGEQLHLTVLDWDKQPVGEAVFVKAE